MSLPVGRNPSEPTASEIGAKSNSAKPEATSQVRQKEMGQPIQNKVLSAAAQGKVEAKGGSVAQKIGDDASKTPRQSRAFLGSVFGKFTEQKLTGQYHFKAVGQSIIKNLKKLIS